jgi:hypothetical protein
MKKIIAIAIIGFLLFVSSFSQGAEETNSNQSEAYKSTYLSENSERQTAEKIETNSAYEGYTLISQLGRISGKAKLIDMDGKLIKILFSVFPSISAFPVKMLSNGEIISGKSSTIINWLLTKIFGEDGFHAVGGSQHLVQMDWQGNHKWSFNNWDPIKVGNIIFGKSARQHHDFLREGNPVGYYAPGQDFVPNGNTLILAKKRILNESISNVTLDDDVIYEVDWDGELTGFIWYGNEHFEEFGFNEDAKESIWNYPGLARPDVDWQVTASLQGFQIGDWLHINSVCRLGKNKWYDEDPIQYSHFHPENLIIDSRHANFILIIDYITGNIVWRVGPELDDGFHNIGQIIGPHNAHIIPDGLPGAGNILVFDNGGAAGYSTIPGQPDKYRNYSRVIEFNPVTLELVWEYSNIKSEKADDVFRHHLRNITYGEEHHFYSAYMSSAQRLPSGNTLITEALNVRVFEVNNNKEIVWEYAPKTPGERFFIRGSYYRAYRIPPDWVSENVAGYDSWEAK